MAFNVAGLPLERNVSQLCCGWEPLQKKDVMHWGDVRWVYSVSDLRMGSNTTLLRKLRNPQRTSPQLHKETIITSVYFLNSPGLKVFLSLVRAQNYWCFLQDSWIAVPEGL